MTGFKKYVEDWQPLESAAFYLCVVLGIVPESHNTPEGYQRFRPIIETSNPLSEFLYTTLAQMIDIGFLEEGSNDEDAKVRLARKKGVIDVG